MNSAIVSAIALSLLGIAAFKNIAPLDTKVATKSTPDQVIALRRAIVGQESANNFQAVNPHSGALGYGQVMPANVPSWTREATGRSLTPREFLGNKNIQIKTLDHKLNQYYKEGLKATGSEDEAVRYAAAKWYSGRGTLKDNSRPQYYRGHPYPSIKSYTFLVKQKYQKEKNK